jgi:hypothetical protein
MQHICMVCGEKITPKGRAELGYRTCLEHGDDQAKSRKFCIAPMHKSNYMLITNRADLLGINNKGGIVK